MTLIGIWQMVLIGYTFSLAGNAADQAARAYVTTDAWTRTDACDRAARQHLPAAWNDDATVRCDNLPQPDSDLHQVQVNLAVPVLFPGLLSWPYTVRGEASAALEGK
ncbi:pilus assembly protein [Streptomyces sp. NPDC001205]